ncbi:uncharacterized protein DUF4282 [Litorimonas taeanensis]|uniref:Uncharacterized protein DUF4282 n=1 Tax=Litorimonas taeanensis TaxID=568099 RepID=A0A420WLB8_9PROT|nr:DUF4282 domain-containing protein [Litorimonas taeanensis]RKQ71814.1 uncharacterized protein DUF4282 [Litorimonas taeanensis]
MKNLFNFFFSFDKLLKEKLIIPFFWLAIIVWGLDLFAEGLAALKLGPIAGFVIFINSFATILFALFTIRLVSEIAVAIFRINDNLSPDGGKSESADIDIMAETKKAAEAASKRARELTQAATERTKSSVDGVKDSMEDISETVQSKAKAATSATKTKVSSAKKTAASKTAASKATSETVDIEAKTTTKAVSTKKAPTAVKKTTTAKKTTAVKKTTTTKKRGPKPGTKALRDKDGNLLKKDGTPRAKPGPKKAD